MFKASLIWTAFVVVGALSFGCDSSDGTDQSRGRVDAGDAGASSKGDGGGANTDPSTAPIPTIDYGGCPPLGNPLPFQLEFVPANVELAAGTSASVEMKIVRRSDFGTLVSVDAPNPPGISLSFNGAESSGMAGLQSGATFHVSVNPGEAPHSVDIPFNSTTSCAHFDNAGTLHVTIK